MISGIQARYNHENTIPKTLDVGSEQMLPSGNKLGFHLFNNSAMQMHGGQSGRHIQSAAVKQATDPGEGIDHYKKLFSFSKYTVHTDIFLRP